MRTAFCVTVVALALLCTPVVQGQGWNQGVNVSAAVRGSMFDRILADLAPIVETLVPLIPFPAMSGEHYNVQPFHLKSLSISSVGVAFDAPDKVSLRVSQLSSSISDVHFHVFTKVIGIKLGCTGKLTASIIHSGANGDVAFTTDSEGKLEATIGAPSLNLRNIHIDLHMDSFFCKIGGAIIDAFVNDFKKFVAHEMNKHLPPLIQHKAQHLVSKALVSVPLKFSSQPKAVNDTLEVSVELVSPARGLRGIPAAQAPHLFTDRDISIGINTQSFDDLIGSLIGHDGLSFNKTLPGKYNTSVLKLFLPTVYKKCPDCLLGVHVGIFPDNLPTAVFGEGSMEVTLNNAMLGFSGITNDSETKLFSVFANVSLSVTNVTFNNTGGETLIQFAVKLNDLSLNLDSTNVGPLLIHQIGFMLESILKNILLPKFNSGFKGIPLKLVEGGVGLDSWKVDLHQDAITLGANLALPAFMLDATENLALPSFMLDAALRV